MTRKPNSTRIPHAPLHQHLLLSGIGCLGAFFGPGVVYAQTASPTEVPVVPSAQDLLAPASAEVPPPAEAIPSAPEALPQPIFSEPAPVAPTAEEVPATAPKSTPVAEENITPPNNTPLVAPNLAEQAESTFGASSPYIDSTPYDLGATQPSSPSVVLSERSTGCQVTLSQGQTAPGSICPEVSGSGAIAAGNPGYDTVNVGAASFSGGGSAGGRIAPSGRDYFNLTVRPPALVGNGNFKLMFPLSIPAVISSVFGWRIHPVSNEPRFHSGTDLAAPEGTPVLAAFSGKVAIADFLGGYGLTVVLRHNRDTQETLYGHLSELFVKPGDTVKQGEVIGRVGSTGISTGPHLHFEFRQYSPNEGWVTLDPSQAIEYSLAQFVKDLQNGTIRTAQNNRLEPLEQLKVMLQQAQEQKQAADAKPSSK